MDDRHMPLFACIHDFGFQLVKLCFVDIGTETRSRNDGTENLGVDVVELVQLHLILGAFEDSRAHREREGIIRSVL